MAMMSNFNFYLHNFTRYNGVLCLQNHDVDRHPPSARHERHSHLGVRIMLSQAPPFYSEPKLTGP